MGCAIRVIILGFGASVLSKLVTTRIKRNLYFEIKDRVVEERFNGTKSVKTKQRTKVYGLDNTKDTRDLLMEILHERIEYHKDKVVSPIIYQELEGLEVKKSGRIEHSDNSHDDQVFSWLMALYVWYYGKDIMDNFGIRKSVIKTDQDLEEAVVTIDEKYADIIEELDIIEDENVKEQLDFLKSDKTMTYEQWMQSEFKKDQESMRRLLSTKLGQKAFQDSCYGEMEELESTYGSYTIPSSVFKGFYDDNSAQ